MVLTKGGPVKEITLYVLQMKLYLKKRPQKVEILGEKLTSLKMFDVFSRICGQSCNERKTNSLWSKPLQLGCNNTLYHRPQRKVFCSCLFIFPTAGEQRRCAGSSQVAIYFTAFFHSVPRSFSFYLAFSVHWSWYCHPSNSCLNYQELPQIVYLNMWNFVFTRSYAALLAADLDWIIGPGYSWGRYILGCSQRLASCLWHSARIGPDTFRSQLTFEN